MDLPGPWAHKGCSTSKLPVIPTVIPKYRCLQCSRTLGSPSMTIYSVPALWHPQVSLFTVSADPGHTQGMSDFKVISDPPSDPQVSVFTVFPHPGLPKYRYLQCTRTLSSPRSASYSVPAPWAPQVSLSLHIQELMHVHILLCTQRRIHRAMEMLK